MIYIIKSGDFLKFGYTSNIKRLSSYYTHNPLIELLHVIKCDDIQIERKLHEGFKDFLYSRKEWYHYSEELLSDIVFYASNVDMWFHDYMPKTNSKVAKLQHGNKGRKHTAESIAKMKMTKRKGKVITFNGVEYKSVNECAKLLGVTRQTIYRRLKA